MSQASEMLPQAATMPSQLLLLVLVVQLLFILKLPQAATLPSQLLLVQHVVILTLPQAKAMSSQLLFILKLP